MLVETVRQRVKNFPEDLIGHLEEVEVLASLFGYTIRRELIVSQAIIMGFYNKDNFKIASWYFHENFVCLIRSNTPDSLMTIKALCSKMTYRKSFMWTLNRLKLTL